MSIESKLANAKEVDIFSELSQEDKMEADLLADIAIQIIPICHQFLPYIVMHLLPRQFRKNP